MVGLSPESAHDAAELGYYIHRQFWNRGIATEAARLVVDHGFRVFSLRRITAGHFQDNPASGRVLSKLGFAKTGLAERPCLAIGASVPSIEMIIEAR
jgi:RimJ/RimL family protein N-acetyltransferase